MAFNAKEYVLELSKKYEINPKIPQAIIQCESGWNPKAKNPDSSASGYFQIIRGTFIHSLELLSKTNGDVFDPKTNIEAGMILLAKEGSSHWNESAHCWKPKVSV